MKCIFFSNLVPVLSNIFSNINLFRTKVHLFLRLDSQPPSHVISLHGVVSVPAAGPPLTAVEAAATALRPFRVPPNSFSPAACPGRPAGIVPALAGCGRACLGPGALRRSRYGDDLLPVSEPEQVLTPRSLHLEARQSGGRPGQTRAPSVTTPQHRLDTEEADPRLEGCPRQPAWRACRSGSLPDSTSQTRRTKAQGAQVTLDFRPSCCSAKTQMSRASCVSLGDPSPLLSRAEESI